MKENYTDITIVLDRSGSMGSIKGDMEQALATFLDEQKKQPGTCTVTLVKFDNDIDTEFTAKDLNSVEQIKLEPRGSTALYDALAEAIDATGKRLADMNEADRPSAVIVLAITDGMNNASEKENPSTIKSRVDLQQGTYNWKFIFMGANQDAVLTASELGIAAGSTLTYAACAAGVSNMSESLTRCVSAYRSSKDYTFSAEERKAAVDAGGNGTT